MLPPAPGKVPPGSEGTQGPRPGRVGPSLRPKYGFWTPRESTELQESENLSVYASPLNAKHYAPGILR